MVMATEQCTDTLAKCGIAVQDLQKVNEVQKSIIDGQGKVIADQKTLLEDQSAWYKNPFTVGTIGFALGIIIESLVQRQ